MRKRSVALEVADCFVVACLEGEGRAYARLGEFSRARDCLSHVLTSREEASSKDCPAIADSHYLLALGLVGLSQEREARKHLDQALAIQIRLYGEDHASVANTRAWLRDVGGGDAEADLESGLAHFIIKRDGKFLANIPEQGKNRFGRPIFQNLQYSDTPTQPLKPLHYIDTKAEPGKKHTYRVIAVNTVGLKSQ